jgi:hypothetical protein
MNGSELLKGDGAILVGVEPVEHHLALPGRVPTGARFLSAGFGLSCRGRDSREPEGQDGSEGCRRHCCAFHRVVPFAFLVVTLKIGPRCNRTMSKEMAFCNALLQLQPKRPGAAAQ